MLPEVTQMQLLRRWQQEKEALIKRLSLLK